MINWLEPLIEKSIKKMKVREFWLDISSPIYIYGTGTFSQDVLNVLIKQNIHVDGFFDRMNTRSVIQGLPVTEPENLSFSDRPNVTVVVAVHNREANIATIVEGLKSLGYIKILTPVDLYDHFSAELGSHYRLTKRTFYRDFESLTEMANDLWADELSREVYTKTLQFRTTGDYSLLHPSIFSTQSATLETGLSYPSTSLGNPVMGGKIC